MGPRVERLAGSGAECADDLWGTAFCDERIRPVFERENQGDVKSSGYENGTLFPFRGRGFRYTVLMIVQWSWREGT